MKAFRIFPLFLFGISSCCYAQSTSTHYKVGAGKKDITSVVKGSAMMGYANAANIVKGVYNPIYARAIVIERKASQQKVVIVNAEVESISSGVASAVWERLKQEYQQGRFAEAGLIISSQHTHSGPGGYYHESFYNISIPGFIPEVHNTIVSGIVNAIIEADKNRKDASIFYAKGEFDPEINVAFNRALIAYNRNPEVQKRTKNENNIAVNRNMELIGFEDSEGNPIAVLDLFGVHATSIPNYNHLISSDNKGFAAGYLEEWVKAEYPVTDFVSLFAQSSSGDVSPNFIWDKKHKMMRGQFDDRFESAKYNGRLQFEKAVELYASNKKTIIEGAIDCELIYVDLSNIEIDPEFANGKAGSKTSQACVGVSVLQGTPEGPGIGKFAAGFLSGIVSLVKAVEMGKKWLFNRSAYYSAKELYLSQGKKDIVIQLGTGKVLGITNISNLPIPASFDPMIKAFKTQYRNGALETKPWVQQIIPIRIIIIGSLAILAVPGEPTTIATQRLENTVLDVLKNRGVETVTVIAYANAMIGYVTTKEEYEEQCYEGGHNLYGQWTLAALQTKFKFLATEMLKEKGDRKLDKTIRPKKIDEAEIRLRTFEPQNEK